MTSFKPSLARTLLGGMTLAVITVWSGAVAEAQQGALYVVQDKVGIGTEAPAANLEVQGDSGTTAILVEEKHPASMLRNLLVLDNQGPPRIVFNDRGIGKSWRVGAYFGNKFRFDTPSGTGVEMEIDRDGDVTITGTLNQGSSRTFKENFADVDPQGILDRVAALPITRWSYIADPEGTRHLGPVAEDFRAAFELGQDATHLAPSDTAGVALAAIKGLNQVVQAEKAEVAGLRQDNARLQATIDAMASAQEQLLRRLEALESGR